ncbi:Abi-alpha family protein [Rhizobium leguminosarum]|uniref:Abi-alpha family protein n=1 Tax=Rhizobium leguminosarum TaxID=384 RepID=UPI00048483FE|nr:Abi-alpha family protein [Rhizobium leguminosarum]
MTIDPETAIAAAEAAGKVFPKTAEQVDKFGTDVMKTVRLLLAPLQYSAAWQDRLEAHIEKAVRRVPEEQRVPPVESLAVPIVEKLRFQPEGDPITELYINLLSRAMDGQRVGEAHPAFFTVITQLAPDELLFLNDIASRDESFIMAPSGRKVYPTPPERDRRLVELEIESWVRNKVTELMFGYETLNQPELFPVYQEHLQHLGLIKYINAFEPVTRDLRLMKDPGRGMRLFTLGLTDFGGLFLKACTQMRDDGPAIRA